MGANTVSSGASAVSGAGSGTSSRGRGMVRAVLALLLGVTALARAVGVPVVEWRLSMGLEADLGSGTCGGVANPGSGARCSARSRALGARRHGAASVFVVDPGCGVGARNCVVMLRPGRGRGVQRNCGVLRLHCYAWAREERARAIRGEGKQI